MKFNVPNRFISKKINFTAEIECDDNAERSVKLGLAVRWANKNHANLSDADLSGANLRDADLRGASLSGADLSDADLSDADLCGADLSDADLCVADLSGANLSGADLRGANLRGANLSGANLSGASLRGANLRDANLRDADLSGADLRGSSPRGADLSGANLNVEPFKQDFIAEVLKLPNELEKLRDTITAGKIDGSTYLGSCSCLAGTIGHGNHNITISDLIVFRARAESPRECWFAMISPDDTPENNFAAKFALEWTEEAIAIRDNIRGIV